MINIFFQKVIFYRTETYTAGKRRATRFEWERVAKVTVLASHTTPCSHYQCEIILSPPVEAVWKD